MIKEALAYIVGMKAPVVQELGGVTYSDKQLFEIHAEQHLANALKVSTLASIVAYIKENPDNIESAPYMVHIRNYNEVALILPLVERTNERPIHMVAANSTKQFSFASRMDREMFNIALQTQFVTNDNLLALIQVVGTIQEENGVTMKDDGFSQQVTAKTGVASVSNVVIPNPLLLSPYRTFAEVEQPESMCVFRIHERMNCALYEADGERWKVDCINNIKDWFNFELKEQIESGEVVLLG